MKTRTLQATPSPITPPLKPPQSQVLHLHLPWWRAYLRLRVGQEWQQPQSRTVLVVPQMRFGHLTAGRG